jgi:hypothetical protein
MNYIKPDDIKEYVSQHPEGIAGMSEELTAMVNHFAELIVKECLSVLEKRLQGDMSEDMDVLYCIMDIEKHFGIEE